MRVSKSPFAILLITASISKSGSATAATSWLRPARSPDQPPLYLFASALTSRLPSAALFASVAISAFTLFKLERRESNFSLNASFLPGSLFILKSKLPSIISSTRFIIIKSSLT
jgi:hypothetical protein